MMSLEIVKRFIDGIDKYEKETGKSMPVMVGKPALELIQKDLEELEEIKRDIIINNALEEFYKVVASEFEIPRDLLSPTRFNIENVKATLISTKIEKSMLEPKVYYDDKEIQARLETLKKEKAIIIPMDDEIGLKTIIDTYSVGETVIYQNGDKFELGIIKRVCGNDEYFVNYHTGDTAARTHARHLHKIANSYAFHVYRLDTEDNERK